MLLLHAWLLRAQRIVMGRHLGVTQAVSRMHHQPPRELERIRRKLDTLDKSSKQ